VGQLFSVTTNPAVATGDGIAAAYRAGVRIADMEFIQFHPTALYESENPRFLISEAMRGEGAHILNIAGDRIMLNKHPLAELAPRDVVVRAMALHMIDSGDDHLYLDVRHLDQEELHAKFPMITSELEKRGFDVSSDLIPISFAAHYTIGGVVTDYHGRSSIRNLYACGETACTGVHGANRLASNSLLEGIVYSNRIARQINDRLDSLEMEKPSPALSATVMRDSSPLVELRSRVTETALRYGGVFRSAKRLKLLHGHLLEYENELTAFSRGREYYELKNLIEIAHLLRRAALNREESRGTHQRQEFSQTDDFWQQHRITFEGDDMTIRSDMTEYID
jgi:L-aspartate oxidase